MGNAYRNAPDKAYFDQKFSALEENIINYLAQRFNALERAAEVGDIRKRISEPIPAEAPPNVKRRRPVEKDECQQWKEEMIQKCETIVKKYPNQYTNYNAILKMVYRRMDNQYGVCLAQYAIDHRKGSEKRPSTLEVISVKAKLRSLFEAILYTLEEESRLRVEKEQAATDAMLLLSRQEIIQPLIEARGDKSAYGCTTYMLVGKRMQLKKVDFEAAEKRYREAKGIKRAIKRNELIDSDKEMKRKFAETVAEMLHEERKKADEKAS